MQQLSLQLHKKMHPSDTHMLPVGLARAVEILNEGNWTSHYKDNSRYNKDWDVAQMFQMVIDWDEGRYDLDKYKDAINELSRDSSSTLSATSLVYSASRVTMYGCFWDDWKKRYPERSLSLFHDWYSFGFKEL